MHSQIAYERDIAFFKKEISLIFQKNDGLCERLKETVLNHKNLNGSHDLDWHTLLCKDEAAFQGIVLEIHKAKHSDHKLRDELIKILALTQWMKKTEENLAIKAG